MNFRNILSMVVVAVVAAACGEVNHAGPEGVESHEAAVGMSAREAAAVLRVANEADQATLDEAVGLDARAAWHIVQARDSEGEFTTLAQLDAVAYVGEAALEQLRDWSATTGLVDCADCSMLQAPPAAPEGVVLGVSENSYAALAILAAANDASQAELDGVLDERAAAAIVAERSERGAFHSLARLETVPHVGARAFTALLVFAQDQGLEPFCGDGLVQAAERCDGTPGCNARCTGVK